MIGLANNVLGRLWAAAQAFRAYDAAAWSRYRRKSRDFSHPDARIQRGAWSIRADARALDENYDLAGSVINELVNRIVGDGIKVRPMVRGPGGALADDLNASIRRAYDEWSRSPETSGQFGRAEMEAQACMGWFRDGEVFARHITSARFDYRGAVAYAVELIDPDFVPLEFHDESRGILQGIEINAWRAPRAYHVMRSDPSSQVMLTIPQFDVNTKRIGADEMMHLAYRRRFNQLRGISVFHAVINRLKDTADYEESERIAAKVAANFSAVIVGRSPIGARVNPVDKNRDLEMQAGMIKYVGDGGDVRIVGSDRPNANLPSFLSHNIRMVAAGVNARASGISRNYTESNYSSMRQELVDSRNPYDRMRGYFINQFARPVYQGWLTQAILQGVIQTRGADMATVLDAEFRGPGEGWVDKAKEVSADVDAVEAGFKSRQQVILDYGGEPAEVDAQIEADIRQPGVNSNAA